jgi:hypothetical protein
MIALSARREISSFSLSEKKASGEEKKKKHSTGEEKRR